MLCAVAQSEVRLSTKTGLVCEIPGESFALQRSACRLSRLLIGIDIFFLRASFETSKQTK